MGKINPCLICGGVNVYTLMSRGDYSYSHPCRDRTIQRFGFSSTEHALIVWNSINRPVQAPDPEAPPLSQDESEIPALNLSPRKKRDGLKVKTTLDEAGIHIIEVEIGFSEMRKYSTRVNSREEIGSERVESATLRAKVGEGEDPQAIMEALRQMAGRMVEGQHTEFEKELDVKSAANNPPNFNINALLDPSYAVFRDRE